MVVVVAYFIRRRLHETPAFEEAKANDELAKLPVLDLLRDHWRDVLRVICCAFIAAVSTVFGNLAIAYGAEVGVNESITLWLVVAANVVALFTQPMFGMLADRIGRKPVFIYGALSSAVFMPFYLLSMEPGQRAADLHAGRASPSPAGTRRRTPSGRRSTPRCSTPGCGSPAVAIGTQLGFLMAGFAPTIVTGLGGVEDGGWVVTAVFTAVIALIAADLR